MNKLSRVGSKHYSERLFLEKEKWHRRQARMSFARKLGVLDELFEMAKDIPKLRRADDKPSQGLE